MRRLLLKFVAMHLLNEKGKRIFFTASLYQMFATLENKETDFEKLNEALNLTTDTKGTIFPAVLYDYLWVHQIQEKIKVIPEYKVKRFIMLTCPCWLKYKDSRRFSLERDIDAIMALVKA